MTIYSHTRIMSTDNSNNRMIEDRIREIMAEFTGGKPTVFAKKAGIPPSTFSGYLDGRVPHADHLVRIRETYGISIDWLLIGKGHKYIDGAKENLGINNDDELLGDIKEWLVEEQQEEKSILVWFRIQFEKSFPDFKSWQKKRNKTSAKDGDRRAA